MAWEVSSNWALKRLGTGCQEGEGPRWVASTQSSPQDIALTPPKISDKYLRFQKAALGRSHLLPPALPWKTEDKQQQKGDSEGEGPGGLRESGYCGYVHMTCLAFHMDVSAYSSLLTRAQLPLKGVSRLPRAKPTRPRSVSHLVPLQPLSSLLGSHRHRGRKFHSLLGC